MKGTFHIAGQSLEITLDKQVWNNDDILTGKLNLTSQAELDADTILALNLCEIDLRKLKKKDPKAFQSLQRIELNPGTKEYDIHLDPNQLGHLHVISDGVFSVAVVIEENNNLLDAPQLQLQIKPSPVIDEFLKIFETFKRCSIKSIKNKKKEIEVKLKTPTTGEMAKVDSLALLINLQNKNLKLTYQFQIKKIVMGGAGVETKKEKIKVVQELEEKDFMSFGELDQQKCLSKIDQAFQSALENSAAS